MKKNFLPGIDGAYMENDMSLTREIIINGLKRKFIDEKGSQQRKYFSRETFLES